MTDNHLLLQRCLCGRRTRSPPHALKLGRRVSPATLGLRPTARAPPRRPAQHRYGRGACRGGSETTAAPRAFAALARPHTPAPGFAPRSAATTIGGIDIHSRTRWTYRCADFDSSAPGSAQLRPAQPPGHCWSRTICRSLMASRAFNITSSDRRHRGGIVQRRAPGISPRLPSTCPQQGFQLAGSRIDVIDLAAPVPTLVYNAPPHVIGLPALTTKLGASPPARHQTATTSSELDGTATPHPGRCLRPRRWKTGPRLPRRRGRGHRGAF